MWITVETRKNFIKIYCCKIKFWDRIARSGSVNLDKMPLGRITSWPVVYAGQLKDLRMIF